MMKKSKPAELETNSKPTSLYDCAVCLKALKLVMESTSDLLENKVKISHLRKWNTQKAWWTVS